MARLQYLLSTLHEGRYRSPCKTRFRLAAGLYREGVEPSGALRKVSDSGYIVVLLSQALPVASWSHARRYFVEALDAGDTRAALPLSFIGRLFEVEREASEQQVDEAERLRRRDTLSRPVTEQLGRWVADTYNREPPKSPLARACFYTINQWKPLSRFLEDARLPLHNNASELRLREIAVGRKNYLFAGSDAGAERAACVYTLVATCVLAGVEPWAYLTDVLEKLATGWPQRRLEELLPPMWKAARAAATQTPSTTPSET